MNTMNCLYFLIFCFCTGVVSTDSVETIKTYSGYQEFRVAGHKANLDEFEAVIKLFDEPILYSRQSASSLQIIVSPEMVQFFENTVQNHKLHKQLIFRDIAEVINLEKATSRRGNTFSWNSYYDIDDIYGYLQNMSTSYPQWTELVVGGESYEGRQIKGLRINTQEGRTENKPAIFIESGKNAHVQCNADEQQPNYQDYYSQYTLGPPAHLRNCFTTLLEGIHAREWITPATTTYFINQLLTSNEPNIVALRNQFDWHIFPSVNPDGYHYSYTIDRMWRKTRSKSANGCYGADPNRNWDYNWLKHGASNRPCDFQTYGGSKPFSENETRTLSAYISNMENLLGYIAFHADAQMLLVPYSDSEEHQDNYDDLINIGKQSLEYGYKVNGAKYDGPATAAEVLYKASGGSMDWVRFALGTPLVYTYELRGYYFHWPPHLIYQQGDEVTQMMLGLTDASRDLGYFK